MDGTGVREIIGDVKGFPNFLRGLALDHVCDSLASRVEEGLDVQIIRRLHGLVVDGFGDHTRIISNNISWSTCMNFWSQSSMSVDFLLRWSSSLSSVGSSL